VIFALLLWVPPLGTGPAAEDTSIPVAYLQLGEGQGQEAAREGRHAAEPAATPGAAPAKPELTAQPGSEATPAAAGAPEQGAEAKPEEQPTEPPKAEPADRQNADKPPPPQPAATVPTPQPQPVESRPQVAERAPEAAEMPLPKPPVKSPDELPPTHDEAATPPKQPADRAKLRARRAEPKEEKEPEKKAETRLAESTAPPAPPAPAAGDKIALAPLPIPDQPKLPPRPKFINEPPEPSEKRLPPAPKSIEAPPGDEAKLPPRSEFKPGTPGDIRRNEPPGRASGTPGEEGASGSQLQAGGGPARPGAAGGGRQIERQISALQGRIDRLLLVYQPDYPDVVELQHQIDELYAALGPLSPEELADATRHLGDCWAQISAGLGATKRQYSLALVLDRDGVIRDVTLDDAEASQTIPADRLLQSLRNCGPLPLPPERYLLWRRLSLRVGGS
jgi:hypothetical protein